MKYSILDQRYEVTKDVWVVSLVNTITGFNGVLSGGHSAILVEGIYDSGLEYVCHCDIHAEITKEGILFNTGYISEINVFEEYRYGGDYSKCKGWSWYANPEKLEEMVASMKKDRDRVEQKNPEDRILFDYKKFFYFYDYFSNSKDVKNCMSWCKDKLEIAGIGVSGKDKPKKVEWSHPSCSLL